MAKKKTPKGDALDALLANLEANPKFAIALMLWQDRFRVPEMARLIKEEDLSTYQASMEYMEATPEIRFYRRPGRPAQPAVPASKGKRAVPATAALPAAPFISVMLVRKGTLDCIKPIENSEEAAKIRDQAEAVRRARDNVLNYSVTVRQEMGAGVYSTANIGALCAAAETLARAAG